MLIIAIVFFALAALLGLFLLSYVLQGKETPKGVVFIHGPLAATGLVLLIIYALNHSSYPIISIVLFVIAALGGATLLFIDLSGKPIPKWMALGHGTIAVIGFIFLLVFTYSVTA